VATVLSALAERIARLAGLARLIERAENEGRPRAMTPAPIPASTASDDRKKSVFEVEERFREILFHRFRGTAESVAAAAEEARRLLHDTQTAAVARELAREARFGEHGQTLLMVAAGRSCAMAQALLPFSDADERAGNGLDALFEAAVAGDEKTVLALLAAGSSASAKRCSTAGGAPRVRQGMAEDADCALGAAMPALFLQGDRLAADKPASLRAWGPAKAFWAIFDALADDPAQARHVGATATLAALLFRDSMEQREKRMAKLSGRAAVPMEILSRERRLAEFPFQAIMAWADPQEMAALIERSAKQAGPELERIPRSQLAFAQALFDDAQIKNAVAASQAKIESLGEVGRARAANAAGGAPVEKIGAGDRPAPRRARAL
jgi:hypothetical protein